MKLLPRLHRLALCLGVALVSILVRPCDATLSTPSKEPTHIFPISELRTWLGPAGQSVSVRGVLTRLGPDSFVQDSSAGVMVQFDVLPRLKVGDEVEVTGLPRQETYGSLLVAATARVLWGGAPTPPVAVKVGQAARGDFDNEFVEVEASLDQIETHPGSEVRLRASADGQHFLILLENARRELTMPSLDLHSMVRFRGICSMNSRLTRDEVPFVLLMRSGDDAEQLAGPPWWTPALLLRDLLFLLCILLLFAIGRTRIRNDRSRALQQEREHIAHELHDTLAQSFAGVSFQLQAVRSKLPGDRPALSEHVDLAINMVRYSHQEARRSIATLRARGADGSSISQQIVNSLERMTGNVPLDVQVDIRGIYRTVPLRISNALVRVAQEAGANAIHHASATRLTVRLIYTEQSLVLTIEDNGSGFDLEAAKGAPGFGLVGMLTRMRKIDGSLEVTSTPGKGTFVSASIPLTDQPWWRRGRHADDVHHA